MFDPLAVMLVIAYNQCYYKINRKKNTRRTLERYLFPTLIDDEDFSLEEEMMKKIMNEWISLVKTEMTDYIMI